MWTPLILMIGLGSAHFVEWQRQASASVIDVGNQASPQMVFFGVEYQARDLSSFVIPIEAICGYFFLVIALAMMGPGQQLGRALARIPNRLEAYTIDIVGSIVGIVVFAACSFLELPPTWWFALVMAGFVWFLAPDDRRRGYALALGPALVLVLSVAPQGTRAEGPRQQWSPYYRIDYHPAERLINVNLIGHQQMQPRDAAFPAYALPHLLNRDAGGKPFGQVLIIGAGSGNDVSRALAWGAERVDAVEIDPVIQRIGKRDHPDRPYDDPRVFVHLNDGRNFLKARQQAIRPDHLRAGRLAGPAQRLQQHPPRELPVHQAGDGRCAETAAAGRHVRHVQLFPPGLDRVAPAEFRARGVRQRGAGPQPAEPRPTQPRRQSRRRFHDADRRRQPRHPRRLRAAARVLAAPARSVRSSDAERLRLSRCPTSAIGWRAQAAEAREKSEWKQFRLTEVNGGAADTRLATDDWPMLYLREPMIPGVSLRGGAIMAVIAALMLAPFLHAARRRRRPQQPHRDCWCRCSSSAPASCWSRPRPSSTWRCSSAAPGS